MVFPKDNDTSTNQRFGALALLPALLFAPADYSGTGPVVDIQDGDTIIVVLDKHPTVVRLANIDAPDLWQPYGEQSKQSLSTICIGKYAALYKPTDDDQGRTVAHVLCGGEDAAAHQVEVGLARVSHDGNDNSLLDDLEHEAQARHRGIWGLKNHIPTN